MGVSNFTQNNSGGNGGGNANTAAMLSAAANSGSFNPNDLMVNMNKKKHTPTLFRDKVIEQLMSVLIGESKPNAMLVGPAGTGKTKIAEELAFRIEQKDPSVPPILHDYTIWSLQLSDIVSGSGVVGEIEEKTNEIIDYLSDSKNKAIVFIDEIHTLFSGTIYKNIAQMLKPALSRGRIKCIGATTTQEVKSIETDPAFNRRFTKVIVDELTREQTLEILKSYKATLTKHYNTTFNLDDQMAMSVIKIADEFCSVGSHRPDNALTLLDRSVANAVINKQKLLSDPDPNVQAMAKSIQGVSLSEDSIKRTAFKITTGNHELKPFNESEFRTQFSVIRGQDDIIEKLTKIIKLYDMHVRPRTKPLTFLFAGSSGVGKTEITKILANSYIGEKPIILNMAEYHSSASINRIIGSPAGYVGYDDNNELPFDILDTNPYQVILLDEFEKCNRQVQRLFMSVFDEGYMKTNTGKTIDFSKAIIIATTNAGCTVKGSSIGLVQDANPEKTIAQLSDFFDVELLNRFNYRLTFNNITKEIFSDIMRESYEKDVAVIKSERPRIQIDDKLDDITLKELVDKHFDEKLGARPVNTAITEYIDNLLLTVGTTP